MSISWIPQETIGDIAGYLGTEDLLRLCLVSSRWRAEALYVLHGVFVLSRDDAAVDYDTAFQIVFLTAVVRTPRLAEAISSLTVMICGHSLFESFKNALPYIDRLEYLEVSRPDNDLDFNITTALSSVTRGIRHLIWHYEGQLEISMLYQYLPRFLHLSTLVISTSPRLVSSPKDDAHDYLSPDTCPNICSVSADWQLSLRLMNSARPIKYARVVDDRCQSIDAMIVPPYRGALRYLEITGDFMDPFDDKVVQFAQDVEFLMFYPSRIGAWSNVPIGLYKNLRKVVFGIRIGHSGNTQLLTVLANHAATEFYRQHQHWQHGLDVVALQYGDHRTNNLLQKRYQKQQGLTSTPWTEIGILYYWGNRQSYITG